MMNPDEIFMLRCIELARKGAGFVAPNPLVGAVLVHDGKIIGEGWHGQYGQPHAEPNCLENVQAQHRNLIHASTMYVSLEPCAHFGKTPPCANLIIHHKIPRVVIGSRDPYEQVDGKGMERLKQAGTEVLCGVLEDACKELNKRFFTFHQKKRPYVIVKWAETANGKISGITDKRLQISNEYSNRLVHRWRSEETAILVGTQTALLDDPALTNRLYTGKNPVRLVIDRHLRLPDSLKLFDQQQPTIIFNEKKEAADGKICWHKTEWDSNVVEHLLQACYEKGIQSILVEGGAKMLQSVIDTDLWDEARVIVNDTMFAAEGLDAPRLSESGISLTRTEKLATDTIFFYKKQSLTLSGSY